MLACSIQAMFQGAQTGVLDCEQAAVQGDPQEGVSSGPKSSMQSGK